MRGGRSAASTSAPGTENKCRYLRRRLRRRLYRRRLRRLHTSFAVNADLETSVLLAQKRCILMRFKRISNFVAIMMGNRYRRTVIQLLYMKVVAEKVFI
jgi:hypothetical protein